MSESGHLLCEEWAGRPERLSTYLPTEPQYAICPICGAPAMTCTGDHNGEQEAAGA